MSNDVKTTLNIEQPRKMAEIRMSDSNKRYICRKCSVDFIVYKGMKRVGPVGSGIGYCEAHNPPAKKGTA